MAVDLGEPLKQASQLSLRDAGIIQSRCFPGTVEGKTSKEMALAMMGSLYVYYLLGVPGKHNVECYASSLVKTDVINEGALQGFLTDVRTKVTQELGRMASQSRGVLE